MGRDPPAQRPPQEAQHRRAEDDEDPGVDDGVDGQQAQGDEVSLQTLLRPPSGMEVHIDLQRVREHTVPYVM